MTGQETMGLVLLALATVATAILERMSRRRGWKSCPNLGQCQSRNRSNLRPKCRHHLCPQTVAVPPPKLRRRKK